MLVLEDLKGLPRESWPRTRVREAMRPVEEKLFIEASAPLWRAAEIMRRNGIGALAVIDADGHLVGFLDHTQRRKPD
jgi:CBS domain-containing protein